MTPNELLPIVIPIAVLAIIFLRARKPRRVHHNRLWILPAVMVVAVGFFAWGMERVGHAFGLTQGLVVVLAAAAGVGFGVFRAHSLKLHRDETGAIWVTPSVLGLVVLAVVMLLRQGIRMVTGTDPDPFGLVPLGGISFGVGVIFTRGVMLYRRCSKLHATATTNEPGTAATV